MRGYGRRFGFGWLGGLGRRPCQAAAAAADGWSLDTLRPGQRARVACIGAGNKARCRLAALGLLPGSPLEVVANAGVGPLLLSVGDSRLMVERGIAAKVQVQAA